MEVNSLYLIRGRNHFASTHIVKFLGAGMQNGYARAVALIEPNGLAAQTDWTVFLLADHDEVLPGTEYLGSVGLAGPGYLHVFSCEGII